MDKRPGQTPHQRYTDGKYAYKKCSTSYIIREMQINRRWSSGSRQWHRSFLNSPLPKDTSNLQLHTEQFPLKEIQKLAELLYIRQIKKKKNSTLEWIGGWDTRSPQTPTPSTVYTTRMELPTPNCFWGVRYLDPSSNTPPCKTSTWVLGLQNI